MMIAAAMPTRYISAYTWMNSGPMWKPLTDGLGMCNASLTGGAIACVAMRPRLVHARLAQARLARLVTWGADGRCSTRYPPRRKSTW